MGTPKKVSLMLGNPPHHSVKRIPRFWKPTHVLAARQPRRVERTLPAEPHLSGSKRAGEVLYLGIL